ncbi:MAG: hypothetical protein JF616_21460 [Fibrobacteres bacterium]|nr:hypothetical protein [Fibrobacterota bacterium]
MLAAASAGAARLDVDWTVPWKDPAGRSIQGLSPVIEPVWCRINIWLPWKRWNPDDPASLPRFEPFVREAALVMATGARPDGPYSVPDLYRDSAGRMLPFDPKHPFFNALKILRARGIRPVIDVGPVPAALSPGRVSRPGNFQWNVAGPSDAEAHYRYLKALFAYVRDSLGIPPAEVGKWGWQLGREPDNRDTWDPRHADRHADMGNLEEYEKLYDCSAAALRDAGLGTLQPGNLVLPFAGALGFSSDSWTAPLLDFLAHGPNRCPEHLQLPRFRPGRDTLLFQFSAYGGNTGSQIGHDPRQLARMIDRLRWIAERRFPDVPVRLNVAEGNYFEEGSPLLNRSDGTARGAAWNAGVWKEALDEGLSRYQQWGFVSSDHISRFSEHGGLASAPANVAAMYLRMQGERRASAALKRGFFDGMGGWLDAIASGSDSVRHILVFRFDREAGARGSEEVEISAKGLSPGRAYAVRHFRVDREHSSYLEAWQRDMAAAGLSVPAPDDACMEFQFGDAHRRLWEAKRGEYARRARLAGPAEDSLSVLRADAGGTILKRLVMEANSVSLLEIR